MIKKYFRLALIAFFFCCSISTAAQSKGRYFLDIGTGEVSAVYYPIGGGICRILNKTSSASARRYNCTVQATPATIYNVNALRKGEIDFAIIQDDWLHYGYNGQNLFKPLGAFPELRVVMSLYPEKFTLIVRKDSDIYTLDDIKNKVLNVGVPGSGVRATMQLLLDTLGLKKSDFRLVTELKIGEQAEALCDHKIDVAPYMLGHPSGAIREASLVCGIRILSFDRHVLEEFVMQYPFYFVTTIPENMYSSSSGGDALTFGTMASLVTTSHQDYKTVYDIVKTMVNNVDYVRGIHPVLQAIDSYSLITHENIPIHDAAKDFYKENKIYPR